MVLIVSPLLSMTEQSRDNPRTKDPHLSIIGLGHVQLINNLIEKYIHLATLKIIFTPQLAERDKLFLYTHGLLMHAGAIYQ